MFATETQARAGTSGAAERLLEAATHLFAAQGYNSVSTRALTRAAGVNLSAITYHFEGKKGLYRAVIERLISDTEPLRRALMGELRQGIAAAAGDRGRLGAVALALVRRLIATQLSDRFPQARFQLMLREVTQPTFAFDRVLSGHVTPLQDAICQLVAAARGGDPAAAETKILAHAIIGQCLMFGIGRPVVLARLGWAEVSDERLEIVTDTVGRAVLAALGLPPPVGPAPGT